MRGCRCAKLQPCVKHACNTAPKDIVYCVEGKEKINLTGKKVFAINISAPILKKEVERIKIKLSHSRKMGGGKKL